MKKIYLVISQTGSIVSRIISRVTGDKYSHVSISLEDDLSSMYSFGRRYTNFIIPGGFVKESTSHGILKKFFSTTDIKVVQLAVQDEKFEEIKCYIAQMYAQRKKYHYNYIGVFFAKRGMRFSRKNSYYCSEFIKDILERFELVGEDELAEAIRPIELLNVRCGKVIYSGKLCEFAK